MGPFLCSLLWVLTCPVASTRPTVKRVATCPSVGLPEASGDLCLLMCRHALFKSGNPCVLTVDTRRLQATLFKASQRLRGVGSHSRSWAGQSGWSWLPGIPVHLQGVSGGPSLGPPQATSSSTWQRLPLVCGCCPLLPQLTLAPPHPQPWQFGRGQGPALVFTVI